MKTPNNKVVFLFLAVVLVVTGTITTSVYLDKKKNLSTQNPDGASNIIVTAQRNTDGIEEIDTDGDGLPDWREIVERTDPNNPDTDGDGTSDGAEIQSDRNPRVAGPGDENKTLRENRVVYEFYEPNTLTDNLSKNLFANYISLKQQGVMTPENEAQLIAQIVSDVEEQTAYVNKYRLSTLSTLSVPTDVQIRQYGNSFAEAQLKTLTTISTLENLSDIAEQYKLFAATLHAIPVPKQIAETHLQLINDMYNFYLASLSANSHQTDPTKTLLAIPIIRDIEARQEGLYATLVNYFEENDILFNEDEPGRMWNTSQ